MLTAALDTDTIHRSLLPTPGFLHPFAFSCAPRHTREDLKAVCEILRLLLQVARFPSESLCLFLRAHQGVFVSVPRFEAPGC